MMADWVICVQSFCDVASANHDHLPAVFSHVGVQPPLAHAARQGLTVVAMVGHGLIGARVEFARRLVLAIVSTTPASTRGDPVSSLHEGPRRVAFAGTRRLVSGRHARQSSPVQAPIEDWAGNGSRQAG